MPRGVVDVMDIWSCSRCYGVVVIVMDIWSCSRSDGLFMKQILQEPQFTKKYEKAGVCKTELFRKVTFVSRCGRGAWTRGVVGIVDLDRFGSEGKGCRFAEAYAVGASTTWRRSDCSRTSSITSILLDVAIWYTNFSGDIMLLSGASKCPNQPVLKAAAKDRNSQDVRSYYMCSNLYFHSVGTKAGMKPAAKNRTCPMTKLGKKILATQGGKWHGRCRTTRFDRGFWALLSFNDVWRGVGEGKENPADEQGCEGRGLRWTCSAALHKGGRAGNNGLRCRGSEPTRTSSFYTSSGQPASVKRPPPPGQHTTAPSPSRDKPNWRNNAFVWGGGGGDQTPEGCVSVDGILFVRLCSHSPLPNVADKLFYAICDFWAQKTDPFDQSASKTYLHWLRYQWWGRIGEGDNDTRSPERGAVVQVQLPCLAATSHNGLFARVRTRLSSADKLQVLGKGAMTRSPRSIERAKSSFEVAKGTESKKRNACIYTSYEQILNAKGECYPKELCLTYTKGEEQLQSLLDHTPERLLVVQKIVLQKNFPNEGKYILQMTHKWGCDGSSGYFGYKQKFSETPLSSTYSDVLMISVVPLQLTFHLKDSQEEKNILQNPRTSSTRYCRLIRFRFIKVTPESIRDEFQFRENQIRLLEYLETHELIKTMVGGKVCNALVQNPSAQVCYICGASPKQMNNLLNVVKRKMQKTMFNFGVSTLNAQIRFFESEVEINEFRLRKKEITYRFRSEMGLLVDFVRQGRATTNNGNTSRCFFEKNKKKNLLKLQELTKDLFILLPVILKALSCGYDIDKEAFRIYTFETAQMYVKLYSWFYIPASVHKILIHGHDVMDDMILPIGQQSAEVQEARHREYRLYREHHTRKVPRESTTEDLLHMLKIDHCAPPRFIPGVLLSRQTRELHFHKADREEITYFNVTPPHLNIFKSPGIVRAQNVHSPLYRATSIQSAFNWPGFLTVPRRRAKAGEDKAGPDKQLAGNQI
ncbi:hypothetical protein PR048_019778 [Dryococelus australis]|uniref:Uncharacterized protein n=1 Tax=Dryococelus australis TaxID=614101 RepID=A0ABQ9H4H0_9NEOP|nr:hypothetical protein PR048_019778 [Dryococelus australis]